MVMTDRVALVGVDWGDKKHAFEVRGTDGTRRKGWIEHRRRHSLWVLGAREYPTGDRGAGERREGLRYALSRYESSSC